MNLLVTGIVSLHVWSTIHGQIVPTLQLAYEGETVVFICHSKTRPIWYKDGRQLNGYKVNYNSLILEAVSQHYIGHYHCAGEGKNGRPFVSSSSSLYVGEPNDSKISPSVYDPNVNSKATFHCDGEHPLWFKKSSLFPEKSMPVEKPIHDSQMYVIPSVQLDDEGYYYCYGKYELMNRHFIARSILRPFVADRLFPFELSADRGSTVSFFCDSSKMVEWFFPNQNTPSDALRYNHTTLILRASANNVGEYICKGFTPEHKIFYARASLTIRLNLDQRLIRKLSPPSITVIEGYSAKFQCQSSTAKWSIDSKPWPKNARIIETTLGENTYSTLLFHKVSESNTGKYFCQGKDRNNDIFLDEAHLIVIEKIKYIMPRSLRGKLGDYVSFTCSYAYTPKWSFNGESLPIGASVSTIAHTDVSILTIEKATKGHFGKYTCSGRDIYYNYFSDSVLLELEHEKALFNAFMIPPKRNSIKIGQSTAFLCHVADSSSGHAYSGEVQYKWSFQGGRLPENARIENNNKLIISKVQTKNAGRYKCKVSSSQHHSATVHGDLSLSYLSTGTTALFLLHNLLISIVIMTLNCS